ncbi:hypothetical protein L345_15480, partial [Ophiophagus hannah]
MGVGGTVIPVEYTKDMKVEIGPFNLSHSFTICLQSPLSLLGRDVLCKLRAKITCSKAGLTLDISAKRLLVVIEIPNQLHEDLKTLPTSLWGWDSTE